MKITGAFSQAALEELAKRIILSTQSEPYINNNNLSSVSAWGSVKTDKTIRDAKQEAFDYADNLFANAGKLTAELTDTIPTIDSAVENCLYYYSPTGEAPFVHYLKINSSTLLNLGSTEVTLTKITNTLNSEATDEALSANMGRELNDTKLDKNQGAENVGKVMMVGNDGVVTVGSQIDDESIGENILWTSEKINSLDIRTKSTVVKTMANLLYIGATQLGINPSAEYNLYKITAFCEDGFNIALAKYKHTEGMSIKTISNSGTTITTSNNVGTIAYSSELKCAYVEHIGIADETYFGSWGDDTHFDKGVVNKFLSDSENKYVGIEIPDEIDNRQWSYLITLSSTLGGWKSVFTVQTYNDGESIRTEVTKIGGGNGFSNVYIKGHNIYFQLAPQWGNWITLTNIGVEYNYTITDVLNELPAGAEKIKIAYPVVQDSLIDTNTTYSSRKIENMCGIVTMSSDSDANDCVPNEQQVTKEYYGHFGSNVPKGGHGVIKATRYGTATIQYYERTNADFEVYRRIINSTTKQVYKDWYQIG